ncbi:hypothetical protein CEP51_006589 [Fusarium floridanum]|uniref:Major facilitator superfamily (MFS) profile domain-containing protein n=1 Tax=Fusarium floridanum TaxID=1325733 RepID=A0A428RSH2_9HYPO|nr:hypothetical protein CEP51_006589 [Fusarium floridanum]
MTDSEKQQDDVFSWDQDPNNPQNWSKLKKTVNLGIVSMLAFITPLESSVIVPDVPLLKDDFHETRRPVTSLVVSIFVLGFAFGPLLLSPLSELYGRRLLFNISNLVTFGFSIGSALSPDIASFIVFRFIAGSFGAGPMNIGGGSIADQVALGKRGFVMSIFFTGIFLGPKGLMTVVTFVFLSESHAPTIQKQKARQDMQQVVVAEEGKPSTSDVLLRAVSRPMRMLIRSPIVTGLSLYLALVYGYLYLLFTTFSTVFPEQYGFGIDTLGLAFLGLGIGCMLALIVLSWFSDWLQDRLTEKHGKSKPEWVYPKVYAGKLDRLTTIRYRLLPIVLGIPLLPIGLFVYGWTAQYKVHWIVPIIFTGFTGAGLIFSFLPTQIYMVDAFTTYAASALAATSVVRSIVGGCLPIAGLPLYSALGYGWGNSLLGFIAMVVSIAPLLFWRYGEMLRNKYDVKFD